MRVLDDRQIILEDPAAVEAAAGGAGADLGDGAALPLVAAEVHPRKVGVGGAGQADLLRPALTDEYGLVGVAEAVVTSGEAVEYGRRKSRVERQPHHAGRRVLVLPGLRRQAGHRLVAR